MSSMMEPTALVTPSNPASPISSGSGRLATLDTLVELLFSVPPEVSADEKNEQHLRYYSSRLQP